MINSGHAGFGTTRRENMKNIRSVFLPVVAHAEKVGVDIIIEALTPMESNTIFLLDDLVELIEDLNSDRVKSMLDTVTPLINYEPYYEHFEKLGDKLDYIHFVDSNGIDQTHMGIGTGVLDMRELLDLIRRYHYDGWLSIELLSCGAREPEIYAAAKSAPSAGFCQNWSSIPGLRLQICITTSPAAAQTRGGFFFRACSFDILPCNVIIKLYVLPHFPMKNGQCYSRYHSEGGTDCESV